MPGQHLLDAHGFVRAQVVQHEHVAKDQSRPEDMLHIGTEHVDIGRPFHRHHGMEALVPQSRQQGDIRPVVLRHSATDPHPLGSAPIQPGHRQIDARFIDELQALDVDRGDGLLVVRTGLLSAVGVPLAGVERLFLRGSPRRVRRRDMVAMLIPRPCRCWSRA
jgi:hypothetical protein